MTDYDQDITVWGHELAIERVAGAAFSGSRVLMFSGPRSVGKRKLAQNIARVLNWEDSRPSNPKEFIEALLTTNPKSKNERRWRNRTFRGLIEIDCEKAEQRKLGFLREIVEEFRTRNISVFNRFIILDNAHRLTARGFDLFLKELEEQEDNVWVIIITDRLSEIRPTIRSRSMDIKFTAIKPEVFNTILDHFPEVESLPDDQYETLIAVSGGSLEKCRNFISSGALDIIMSLENNLDWNEKFILEKLKQVKGVEENYLTVAYKALLGYIGFLMLDFSYRSGLKCRMQQVKFLEQRSRLEEFAEALGPKQRILLEVSLRDWLQKIGRLRRA